jgi:pimeloyl-ACP methyl ester carboxylesterase
MPRKNAPKKPTPPHPNAFEHAWETVRHPTDPPPTVSARWLISAAGIAVLAAALCAWGVLCLLFWQGSWQLLYHPTAAITKTPASVGAVFDPVAFATTDAGEPRLKGWWIPATADAPLSHLTVLYLHGQTGNLSDTVDALAQLHAAGVNVLAFDYRGYGQSRFEHPSEAHLREDAEWALAYLTGTRHIAANSIVIDGRDLGANVALEVAAVHQELAGVILEEPLIDPAGALFNDPRARMVPAHALVNDRYEVNAPATSLRIPSLWVLSTERNRNWAIDREPLRLVASNKSVVWLVPRRHEQQDFQDALHRWLQEIAR